MTRARALVTRGAGTSGLVDKPRRLRPSIQHVLIALAAILAFVLNLLVLQQRDATAGVAVAARHLVPGEIVDSDSIRFAQVSEGFAGLESLIGEDRISDLAGMVVLSEIPEDGVLRVSDLAPASSSGLRAMSIPVDEAHAVGASLRIGDRVDVIAVEAGVAEFVVVDVEVLGLASSDASGFGSAGGYYITVAVDPDQALSLAQAINGGDFEVLRATGAPAVGIDGASS